MIEEYKKKKVTNRYRGPLYHSKQNKKQQLYKKGKLYKWKLTPVRSEEEKQKAIDHMIEQVDNYVGVDRWQERYTEYRDEKIAKWKKFDAWFHNKTGPISPDAWNKYARNKRLHEEQIKEMNVWIAHMTPEHMPKRIGFVINSEDDVFDSVYGF